jgi:CBS domain-containing protein
MRAMDVMSRPVYTARPDDPVEQAAALITGRKITSLPVVDPAGDLVGVVSESDLLPHQGAARPVVVADVMTEDVVVAAPREDLAEVAKAMLDYDVRCVPVMEGPELVGVVSRRDILGSLVRTDDVVCTELQVRLDEYAGGPRRWVATVTDGAAVVSGVFDDDAQEEVLGVLARTAPGVTSVQLRPPT